MRTYNKDMYLLKHQKSKNGKRMFYPASQLTYDRKEFILLLLIVLLSLAGTNSVVDCML